MELRPMVLALLVLGACGEEKEEAPENPPPPPVAEDWCEHVIPGPAGTAPSFLAMSEAHALVRFFSTAASSGADEALVSALEGTTVDWDAAALTYAEALEAVCAREVASQALPAAQVEELGGVAVIHPGTGELVLPPSAQAVAIDLRGLPADPGLEQALAKAIAVASTQPVARVPSKVHSYRGMMDELATERGNVYSNEVAPRTLEPFAPAGTRELPVALLTGPSLAPAAARFAVELRLARRAWIFGEPVATAVAESKWIPIGARGLAIRTEVLTDEQGLVPDLISADRSLGDSLEPLLGELPGLGTPPAVERSLQAKRPTLRKRLPLVQSTAFADSPGVARANLLIMHGALRRFFPYFPVVGDGIDERLRTTLVEVDSGPMSRERLVQVLQRLSEVIQDGHGNISATYMAPSGYFPVVLENVGGEPVVRRSALPMVSPGETLVSIDGRPMSEWLADEYSRISAATPGWKFTRAMQRLTALEVRTVFGVRSLDGRVRSVEVTPRSQDIMSAFGSAPSVRGAGRLGDLGAPDLAYINLATEVLSDFSKFQQAVAEAEGARGLVLDMRGYPGGVNHYAVLQHLIPTAYKSARFLAPTWHGPDSRGQAENQLSFEPIPTPSFHGPLILLVGPHAVSAAENFSMALVGAQRARVVGRRTAGTNGNITRLRLPGGIWFTYTGTEVLYPDGSTFHGVGVVPEIEVLPTAEDFAAGRDPELLKAIELLPSGG